MPLSHAKENLLIMPTGIFVDANQNAVSIQMDRFRLCPTRSHHHLSTRGHKLLSSKLKRTAPLPKVLLFMPMGINKIFVYDPYLPTSLSTTHKKYPGLLQYACGHNTSFSNPQQIGFIISVVRRVDLSVARFLIYATGHNLVRVKPLTLLCKGTFANMPASIFSGQGNSSSTSQRKKFPFMPTGIVVGANQNAASIQRERFRLCPMRSRHHLYARGHISLGKK